MADRPTTGTRRVFARVWSPQLENERDIDVFLPPSYARTRRRYPVIYMQDGQNLADPERAFAGTWDLLRALDNLAAQGLEVIVVGIPNSGAERLREYSPFADARHGGGGGDAYLAFVERTLKPLIDRRVRTRPEREATGIFGSSMGGLISLYAFFRAPETFGFVGAMSPSLWFGGRADHRLRRAGRTAPRSHLRRRRHRGRGRHGQGREPAGDGTRTQGLRARRVHAVHRGRRRAARRGSLGRTPRARAEFPAQGRSTRHASSLTPYFLPARGPAPCGRADPISSPRARILRHHGGHGNNRLHRSGTHGQAHGGSSGRQGLSGDRPQPEPGPGRRAGRPGRSAGVGTGGRRGADHPDHHDAARLARCRARARRSGGRVHAAPAGHHPDRYQQHRAGDRAGAGGQGADARRDDAGCAGERRRSWCGQRLAVDHGRW